MDVRFSENNVLLLVPLTGDIRITMSEITFYSEVVKQYIKVPVGTRTDLGSIPQFLQGVFPKDGKAMFGYILHDYLYQTGMFDRNTCDDILKEAMTVLGVVYWRILSVRSGLKLGGWKAYNDYREKENKDD